MAQSQPWHANKPGPHAGVYRLAALPTVPQHEHADIEALPSPRKPVNPPDDVMCLDDFVELALANNPTLVQAAAQIDAARGAAYQAGLLPNPMLGYASDQIGIVGTAGELQGGFVAQEFMTGGKLRLSRQKYLQRARIAETHAAEQRYRVLNDVKLHYYRALAAGELVTIHEAFVANAEDRLQTTREMLNLGQANHPQMLQAEVDTQAHRLDLVAAKNNFFRTWNELTAVIGAPHLEPSPLCGPLAPRECPLAWEMALGELLARSPELRAARQEVRHDEIAVRRERVQPIPNVMVEANTGKNFETNNTVAGMAAGINVPLFDRNQGTVQQAAADLRRSRAEVQRIELLLQSRLAAAYRDYQTAWQYLQDYEQIMLPKAKEAYEMLHASYFAHRAPWMDVLDAKQTYMQLRARYVEQALVYREADVAIRGMLLSGGLMQPTAPLTGGHIDATPKPR